MAAGLSVSKAERVREILARRCNAFRRALRGDPPARPAEEESERKATFEEGVADAVAAGLSVSKAERVRELWARRCNAFRRALRGDPRRSWDPCDYSLDPGRRR